MEDERFIHIEELKKLLKREIGMNENDLRVMSELYRKTRKAVYEEATRPLSNNTDKETKSRWAVTGVGGVHSTV